MFIIIIMIQKLSCNLNLTGSYNSAQLSLIICIVLLLPPSEDYNAYTHVQGMRERSPPLQKIMHSNFPR